MNTSLMAMALGLTVTAPAPDQVLTSQPSSSRLVVSINVKDFGAETVRIGDLDGDGRLDLLLVQSIRATREITCLTAITTEGKVLWQAGEPSADNGTIYSDLAVQIYDWDNDGNNEVLYVRQAKYLEPAWDGRSPRERADRYEGKATMRILAGADGREEGAFSLPAPADDSFLLADLTGRGRREDLVVKDRYWNMWGVSHDGRELWHWRGSTGHYPSIADVDADGRDEVFVGFALVDHDGKVLFDTTPKNHGGLHQDACCILRPADGRWRLLYGNGGIHCLLTDGTELWKHPLGETQHVVAGRFRSDSEVQLVVVDRTPVPTHTRDVNAWGILYLYDLQGKELWHRQQEPGDWAIAPIRMNWFGPDQPQTILVYGRWQDRPAVMYDGQGQTIGSFPMEYTPDRTLDDRKLGFYAFGANIWGDGRDEVILIGARGLCIYANARPLADPALYNETLYPGM